MMMSQLSHHTRNDCCSLLSTLKTFSQINWQFPQECDNFMHKQNRPFYNTQKTRWGVNHSDFSGHWNFTDSYFGSSTKHNGAKTFKFVQLFFSLWALKGNRKTTNCQNCQNEKREKWTVDSTQFHVYCAFCVFSNLSIVCKAASQHTRRETSNFTNPLLILSFFNFYPCSLKVAHFNLYPFTIYLCSLLDSPSLAFSIEALTKHMCLKD